MFIEVPNFLDKKHIKFFRDNLRKFENISNFDSQNREGTSVKISHSSDPTLQLIDQMLFELFSKIVQDVVTPKFRQLHSAGDTGYEYHRYKPGDVCKPHSDGELAQSNFQEGQSPITALRFASVVLHLTTNTDGGDIVFPIQDRRFSTEAGKLLVFPPYTWFPHYTEPSTKDREIIVSWLIYDQLCVGRHK